MRLLVGTNIRLARLRMAITQEELSARSGFSQQYISGLEQGRRNPTIVTIYELAEALHTSPAALVSPIPK